MLGETVALDPKDLRTSSAAMIALGAVLPLLPGHPGVECPLRRLTGVPCPLCGMTTSVEQTLRLHIGQAFAANPGGIAAVVVALVLLALRPARLRIPAALPTLVLSCMWIFELHRFSIL